MKNLFVALLAGAAPSPLLAQETPPSPSAEAQTQAAPEDPLADDDAIVVVGQRLPGQVVGDIPPENVLDSRDIRATGATSISELLEAVESQTGSARGGPVGGRYCCSTASASPASASFATFRPKPSSGWKSCLRKWR
ncbi:hypothetical protein G7076_12025 [Sphingomonas sp. HDW15A]|uniref:hypothetical protein n=1 Tax=Sphingomonas sp. HDW15A TaxID=2714942 RepID=UPI0014093497|nr:hypothetical protein [Sphingomonas sp. HDW15A]QIK97051.1 hypothetical protein G7076_12025 [Sphingomonas sp. HDW15A]